MQKLLEFKNSVDALSRLGLVILLDPCTVMSAITYQKLEKKKGMWSLCALCGVFGEGMLGLLKTWNY